MAVHVLGQPAAQRVELALADLFGDLGPGVQGGGVELRPHHVAQRVALENPADDAAVPVHVLQHAVAVIRCAQAQGRQVAVVPGFGQVFHFQVAFQQQQLQLEADHHVQVIGQLVGIRADQRALYLVDRPVEGIQRHAAQLSREGRLQLRVEVFPKAAAAPNHVLPQAGLALVYARGGAAAQRAALIRHVDALLVHGMPRLVDGAEQPI